MTIVQPPQDLKEFMGEVIADLDNFQRAILRRQFAPMNTNRRPTDRQTQAEFVEDWGIEYSSYKVHLADAIKALGFLLRKRGYETLEDLGL